MLYKIVKRLLDVIIAIFALVLFAPFALVFAVLIFLEDGLPIIYTQERVGKERKLFRLYKFRSMIQDADDLLFSDPQFYKTMRSGSHKVKNDPRVTKIGKFIRKYSIDEFPQFINVLRGPMSFVGPRAYRPDELKKYEEEKPEIKGIMAEIIAVKPGITGLWQVSGRSELSFTERVELEVTYVRKKSILLDLLIILKTPLAVVQARGAV